MNLYEVLGVEPDATAEELKKARQKLAKKHHPDRGGDPERMQQINKAYDVLSDPEARKRYDETGSTEGVKPVEEEAKRLLRQMLEALMNNPDSLENTNLFAQIRSNIKDARNQFKDQMAQLTRHIIKLEKKLKKIECKNGSTWVQELIQFRVDGMINHRNAIEKAGTVLDRCEELLTGYHDSTIEEAPHNLQDAFMQQIQNFKFR